MIRSTKRTPTANCTLPMYMGFLMSEPKSITCTRLSEVMGIWHDSVNRFLLREAYEARDLFNEAARLLNLVLKAETIMDNSEPTSSHVQTRRRRSPAQPL